MYIRKTLCIFSIIVAAFFPGSAPAWAEPAIQAKAAVLIDGRSGQLLWEQNAFAPMPPASTSKILTAIAALETTEMESRYKVSEKAAAVGESNINLQTGEEFDVYNLLLGALIHSGNDACYALAEHVAGSEELFIHWLNLKAKAMLAHSAQMVNSNGLPAENHLIHAYDLALAARYAMENETFREIVAMPQAKVIGGSYTRFYKNTNRLLSQNEHIIGIKTGTTNAAGPCLVSAMEKDGRTLIAVVLNSPDRYGESLEILDYGMEHFEDYHLLRQGEVCGYAPVKGGKAYLPLIAAIEGAFLYPKEGGALQIRWKLPAYLPASVKAGEIVGALEVEDAQGNLWWRGDIAAGEKSGRLN